MDNTTWWGVLIKNGLAALVMLTALYLLYIGYRMTISYVGGKRLKQKNIKYPELLLSEKDVFANQLELGVELHDRTAIQLAILDNNMKELKVLVDEEKESGVHPFSFDITDIEEGNYFVRLKSEYQNAAKKIYIKNT